MEEKGSIEPADERTAGCGFVDPQIVWLAKRGFRPDREGGWTLRCGSGYWWDTVGTFVRCSQDGEGPDVPWAAWLESRPDDQWIVLRGQSLILSSWRARTPEIAVRGCLAQGAERARSLLETVSNGRALARDLYALAMADVRDTLPDLVGKDRPSRKEDVGCVGCQAVEQERDAFRAVAWLAAHGFAMANECDRKRHGGSSPGWVRTCGKLKGGAEARFEIWRSSVGVWAAYASVLLSGVWEKRFGRTSCWVASYISTPDEGPNVTLRKCVEELSQFAANRHLPDDYLMELAKAVLGIYEKALAEIDTVPAGGS